MFNWFNKLNKFSAVTKYICFKCKDDTKKLSNNFIRFSNNHKCAFQLRIVATIEANVPIHAPPGFGDFVLESDSFSHFYHGLLLRGSQKWIGLKELN